jgi:response regulator RpfG family c-di-GMP phosphodiesterase
MPERVLLVDNEAMVRKGLKILLDRAGFEVLEASGGREALEILGPEMVDVVVCDIRMPGVSGLDLLDLVQGRAFYIPVVILTGLLEFETTIRAMQKGAFDYLIKPVKKDTLLVTIERALQHGCLVRENRRVAGLETLFCLTIRTLLRMMELAPYGLEHSHRVSQYARLLADHLRLKPAEKALLEYAALLHDVGMITVDFTFPSRKGPLTERERREIQVHPTAPVFDQTLDGCGELKKAIRHHHEHYDGTGYPDRLKGESIPLLARIIAIADAFESLTSGRPFRDAISPEKAVGVMAEERGRQFDPFLLDTFTEIVLKSRSG